MSIEVYDYRRLYEDLAVAYEKLQYKNMELRDDLHDAELAAASAHCFLLDQGFSPCDNPACNCGSWHKRPSESHAECPLQEPRG